MDVTRVSFVFKKIEGILFELLLIDSSGNTHNLYTGLSAPYKYFEHTKWREVKADVASFIGQEVTLIMKTRPLKKINSRYFITDKHIVCWGVPRLCSSARKTSAKKNIVIIVDGCRADTLKCYTQNKRQITPHIDQLAEDSVVFKNGVSQGIWTLSSFISLFTGCYPSTTNSWQPRKCIALNESVPALPQSYREAGYTTAYMTSHGRASANFGFARGIDQYYYSEQSAFAGVSTSQDIIDRSILFLENTADEDVFLTVHIFETHTPYHISDLFIEDKSKDILARGKSLDKLLNNNKFQYESCIHKADAQIGRLINYLKLNGWYNNATMSLIGDHGTTFETYNVHRKLDEGQIKVPYILKLPEQFDQKNKSVTTPVEVSTSLILTMLDANGLSTQFDCDGKSLIPLICDKEQDVKDYAISEDIYPGYHSISCRTLSDKLIFNRGYKEQNTNKEFTKYEYFNFDEDPSEKNNLIKETKYKNRIDTLKGYVENFLDTKKSRMEG